MLKTFEFIISRMYKIFILKKIIQYLLINFRYIFWKYRVAKHKLGKNEIFFAKYLIKKIGEKKFSLLELGCGQGHLLKYLYKENLNCKLTGYDINAYSINEAKKIKMKNVNFSLVNLLKIKNFNNFDYIISKATLIYLNDAEIKNFFKKLFKSNFKKCFLLELATDEKLSQRTHFFAHNYNKIIQKININKKIKYTISKKINLKSKWYHGHEKIYPVLIDITKN